MGIGTDFYKRDLNPNEGPAASQQRVTVNVGGTSSTTASGAVAPWAVRNNLDPIPADKLTNVASGGLALTSHSGVFVLPTVARTTLTAPNPNVAVNHEIPSLTGADVTNYITNTVVGGVGRLTFLKEGFVSGNVEANINLHTSTAGSSGNTGHFTFHVFLYSSSGNVKEHFTHTEVINDPITATHVDPVDVPITFIPVDAGDYMQFKISFEASNAGRNIVFEIPTASASRREQVDIFFHDKEEAEASNVATWALKTGATGTAPTSVLPQASTSVLTQLGIISTQSVDARIASFAKAAGATGTVPTARLPRASIAAQATLGIININTVDTRIESKVMDWAEAGNTDKIPADKIPEGAGSGVGEDAAPWAEAGNNDPIPPNKLRNILNPTNNVNILRDVSTAGTVSSIQLPANYNTAFRFLLIGGHANSEFGILDTQYLASQATLRSETYNWTRSTRTISGLIKGAYLYGIDPDLGLSEDGWLRATETTTAPIVPTTSANDGIEGIDATLGQVNQYPFFGCRVFDPGTFQILPNIFYKDIAIGQNRVFRVHDEALTKALRITRDTEQGFSFDSFNQTGNRAINEMRSAQFLGFHTVNVITPSPTVNTMTLPPGFRNADLFVAVTKGASNSYWTVWTLKTKFPEYTPRLAPGGAFTPAEPILYAALITIHGDLEIKAEDVSVNEDNLSNYSSVETVQEFIDQADTFRGQTQTQAQTKNYAKVGNTTKIPITDYATIGTQAEIAAISSANLIPNSLYIET